MLNRKQAERFRNPAPEDSHAAYGADLDGGRKRLVYPVFGTDNVHHFLGRRFEAARNGESADIKVGRVLDRETFFGQLLLWEEIAHWKHPDTGEEFCGPQALTSFGNHFETALEVRTADLTEWNPRAGDMHLLDGTRIRPQFPADAISINYAGDVWLPLLDEAVDIEERLCAPIPLTEFRFLAPSSEDTEYWLLGPPLNDGTPARLGAFYPIETLPLSIAGTPINWVGPTPGGEDPLVVTRQQLHLLQTGKASDALRNLVRNTASRVHAYETACAEGMPLLDALARFYGLQTTCRVSRYVATAPTLTSGRNAFVSQASPSSAATEADILPDASR